MKEIKHTCVIPSCNEELRSPHQCLCAYHWSLLTIDLREGLYKAHNDLCNYLDKSLDTMRYRNKLKKLRTLYEQSIWDAVAYLMLVEFTSPELEWDKEGRMTLYLEEGKRKDNGKQKNSK